MSSGMVAEKSRVCRSVGALADDAADVGQEAHVEHHVGLVQHQHLEAAEVERAPTQVVEDAARGADHDLDTLASGR